MSTKADKNTPLNKKFSDLLMKETESRSKPKEWELVLRAHLDEIKQARDLGVGYGKIAELLTEAGVKANDLQVKSFCLKELGESSRKRRKKKPLKVAKPAPALEKTKIKTELKTQTELKKSKPGFRSATEDEDL